MRVMGGVGMGRLCWVDKLYHLKVTGNKGIH